MATTNFTHSCGHPGCVSGRNRADADRQARRLSATPCRECEYQASVDAAIAWAAERGLPPLTGASAKQVAYGELSRKIALMAYGRAVDTLSASAVDAELSDAALQELRDALAALIGEKIAIDDAHTWIEISKGPEMMDTAARLFNLAADRDLIPTVRAERIAAGLS